jgi:hypothetical protein
MTQLLTYLGQYYQSEYRKKLHRKYMRISQTCTNQQLKTIQINQPTRWNNFSCLLLDVYVQSNMFRASLRPSSGAQQLQ